VVVVCREDVRDSHLRGVPDIQRLTRKLAHRKISLQELCQLYMASVQLEQLVGILSGYEGALPAVAEGCIASLGAHVFTMQGIVSCQQSKSTSYPESSRL
jgi:DNA mismatch repair ATPase MutS